MNTGDEYKAPEEDTARTVSERPEIIDIQTRIVKGFMLKSAIRTQADPRSAALNPKTPHNYATPKF